MKSKMATCHGSGYQSPPPIGRTVDRVFEDAQFTGEIYLNGRKLRDYPKLCAKYDLSDTTFVDISRNRLTEVPHEVCEYLHVEKINCYHNVIRSIPDAIQQLQTITHLNLSRNQLTVLPPTLCNLGCLEVLMASNNKLVSLPEEISQLKSLMELDVSCNEISHLPVQIGDLSSLRSLNLRRNFLVELPVEISRLQLYKLDFSSNRIEKIPTVFRKIETLVQLILDHNPLTSPPAYVCIKGRQHIMKYLLIEAIKEDRKRGVLMGSDSDMKRFIRKSLPPHQSSEDLKNMLGAPESKWKRHTVLSNDSGYSTADGSERNGWQNGEIYPLREENNNVQTDMLRKYRDHQSYYQSQPPQHYQQSNHYQQHHKAAESGSHTQSDVPRSRSGSGLHQQSISSMVGDHNYSEPGRSSPAHISASYPQYQQPHHQRQYPHDSPHPQHRPQTSISSHPHTSNMYSSSSSIYSRRATVPSPAFNGHSFDNHTSAHNNSLNGSETSFGLSRQRSNTSLSDYQPRQQPTSSAYNMQRSHSPPNLTKYRSDSPSPRYGLSRPAEDYSGSNSLSSRSAAYTGQREYIAHDRINFHPLPNRLEQVGGDSPPQTPPTPPTPPIIMTGDMEDEFTRELKRQKAEYERKKKQAELIRVQQEEEEEEREKEERRRAALKLQGEQKLLMERQEEQRRLDGLRKQEEFRLLEAKKRKDEEESHIREEEIHKLQESVRIQDGDQIRQKEDAEKRAESKQTDRNNAINKNTLSSQSFKEQRKLPGSIQYRRAASDTLKKLGQAANPQHQADNPICVTRNGVTENSQQSSTSTTPSVSPSPSPRNSVSHLAKPSSPSSSTSHLAKSISQIGTTSHLVKPTGTKSSVPRAANGPAVQNQAVRKTKIAGDRSNTSSPVTARSARTTGSSNLRTQGTTLNQVPSNLRRSSTSSTTDDDSKPKKGAPAAAAVETSRLKPRLDEQNKKAALQGSTVKLRVVAPGATSDAATSASPKDLKIMDIIKMPKAGPPADNVDTNKRINTRPPTNIYGLGRGRPSIGGPKTLEDSHSNFSMRRKEDKEDIEQMDRLRQMVESRLRVTLPDNLAEALRDGVVLCHLANQIRPRSVGSIHVPSPAVPKLTLAKCKRNVDNFLDACKKIGVDQEQLCGPQDIFDEKGISRVAITVAALVAIGTNPRQSAV